MATDDFNNPGGADSAGGEAFLLRQDFGGQVASLEVVVPEADASPADKSAELSAPIDIKTYNAAIRAWAEDIFANELKEYPFQAGERQMLIDAVLVLRPLLTKRESVLIELQSRVRGTYIELLHCWLTDILADEFPGYPFGKALRERLAKKLSALPERIQGREYLALLLRSFIPVLLTRMQFRKGMFARVEFLKRDDVKRFELRKDAGTPVPTLAVNLPKAEVTLTPHGPDLEVAFSTEILARIRAGMQREVRDIVDGRKGQVFEVELHTGAEPQEAIEPQFELRPYPDGFNMKSFIVLRSYANTICRERHEPLVDDDTLVEICRRHWSNIKACKQAVDVYLDPIRGNRKLWVPVKDRNERLTGEYRPWTPDAPPVLYRFDGRVYFRRGGRLYMEMLDSNGPGGKPSSAFIALSPPQQTSSPPPHD